MTLLERFSNRVDPRWNARLRRTSRLKLSFASVHITGGIVARSTIYSWRHCHSIATYQPRRWITLGKIARTRMRAISGPIGETATGSAATPAGCGRPVATTNAGAGLVAARLLTSRRSRYSQPRPTAMPDMPDRSAAMTIMPPAKLATDGCLAEADPHPCDSERRFQRVDQRVLRGRDHLTADGQEYEPQPTALCQTGTA